MRMAPRCRSKTDGMSASIPLANFGPVEYLEHEELTRLLHLTRRTHGFQVRTRGKRSRKQKLNTLGTSFPKHSVLFQQT